MNLTRSLVLLSLVTTLAIGSMYIVPIKATNSSTTGWFTTGTTQRLMAVDINPTDGWTQLNETPPPIIDQPSPITYVVNTTGNTITWHAMSFNPDNYTISVNKGSPTSYKWDGETITHNIDGWAIGTYSVNCTIYDTLGRADSSTVAVTVQSFSTGGGESAPEFLIGLVIIGVVGAIAVVAIVAERRRAIVKIEMPKRSR